mgnify:FL=1
MTRKPRRIFKGWVLVDDDGLFAWTNGLSPNIPIILPTENIAIMVRDAHNGRKKLTPARATLTVHEKKGSGR